MAKTDLTNQRQVFVEEYVRSGDHLEAAKNAGYKDKMRSRPSDGSNILTGTYHQTDGHVLFVKMN